nr:hypothetical protein SYMBAF_50269 [Serratia symbiotica]
MDMRVNRPGTHVIKGNTLSGEHARTPYPFEVMVDIACFVRKVSGKNVIDFCSDSLSATADKR